jgi:hypothetical protein
LRILGFVPREGVVELEVVDAVERHEVTSPGRGACDAGRQGHRLGAHPVYGCASSIIPEVVAAYTVAGEASARAQTQIVLSTLFERPFAI